MSINKKNWSFLRRAFLKEEFMAHNSSCFLGSYIIKKHLKNLWVLVFTQYCGKQALNESL